MLTIDAAMDEQAAKKIQAAILAAKRRAAQKTAVTIRSEWARAIHSELNLPMAAIKPALLIRQNAQGQGSGGAANRFALADFK